MEGEATVTIATLLADVGKVFTQSMAAKIVSEPVLLLFCVAVPLCGLGVGMFSRLIHSRG